MKWKPLLSGMIVGSFAAGISTLLTAPHSGKTTRRRIKQSQQIVINQLDELKTNLYEIKISASKVIKEGKAHVPPFISDVKTSLLVWEDEISPVREELQMKLEEVGNTIQKMEKKGLPL